MKDDPILMSNNTDLIARLRERADALPSPGIPSITTVLCRDAADALAARDAEIERLRWYASCPCDRCVEGPNEG